MEDDENNPIENSSQFLTLYVIKPDCTPMVIAHQVRTSNGRFIECHTLRIIEIQHGSYTTEELANQIVSQLQQNGLWAIHPSEWAFEYLFRLVNPICEFEGDTIAKQLLQWRRIEDFAGDHAIYDNLADFKPQYEKNRELSISTLQQCLETFSLSEEIEDSWCSHCKCLQPKQKKLELWSVPKYLIIHLTRFEERYPGVWSKNSTFVDFPFHLDLSTILPVDTKSPTLFELETISNHYGTTNFGHYYTFASRGGKWYNFNDHQCDEIDPEEVVTSQAYVLFYKAINI